MDEQLLRKHKFAQDHRTETEYQYFVRLNARIIEKKILNRYVYQCKVEHGIQLNVIGNGADKQPGYDSRGYFDGKADYYLNGKLVEIKSHREMRDTLTLKVNGVNRYINENARVLYVNGYKTRQPMYTFISTKKLIEVTQNYRPIFDFEWMQYTYRVDPTHYEWKPLRGIPIFTSYEDDGVPYKPKRKVVLTSFEG